MKEKITLYAQPDKLTQARIKLAATKGATMTGIWEKALDLFLLDRLPDVDAVKAEMELEKLQAIGEDFLK